MNNNVQNSTEGYNKINNWPLNFLRTGYYERVNGHINRRTVNGCWWSDISMGTARSAFLDTANTSIMSTANYYRGRGYAVRCVPRGL